jgi:bacterioferritin-associated ferredoxin
MKLLDNFDFIIIGAGPSGLAAASVALKYGAKVILLDEQPSPGGQIYRNITNSDRTMDTIIGIDYVYGRKLVKDLDSKNIQYYSNATVIDVDSEPHVTFKYKDKLYQARGEHVLLATGAIERSVPIQGWTLSGVMTVGAVQILIKSGQIIPRNAVLVGSGPLLYLVATQLIASGSPPKALIETQTYGNFFAALPYLFRALMSWKEIIKGIGFIAKIRQSGVKRYTAAKDIKIKGNSIAEKIVFSIKGVQHEIRSNTIFLHQGVIPSIQISQLLKIKHQWNYEQHCFNPVVDKYGESSIKSICIAGDGANILGAKMAEISGKISALHILEKLGHINQTTKDSIVNPLIKKRYRETLFRSFIDVLYKPPVDVFNPINETIVCRCEEVTAAEIHDCVSLGCIDPDYVKTFSRCGMGSCQGRYCGTIVTNILSNQLNISPDEVGYYKIRAPIKPITLKELASLYNQ